MPGSRCRAYRRVEDLPAFAQQPAVDLLGSVVALEEEALARLLARHAPRRTRMDDVASDAAHRCREVADPAGREDPPDLGHHPRVAVSRDVLDDRDRHATVEGAARIRQVSGVLDLEARVGSRRRQASISGRWRSIAVQSPRRSCASRLARSLGLATSRHRPLERLLGDSPHLEVAPGIEWHEQAAQPHPGAPPAVPCATEEPAHSQAVAMAPESLPTRTSDGGRRERAHKTAALSSAAPSSSSGG